MRPLAECHIYEVQVGTQWVRAHWEQLDEGDLVRELNPDGTMRTDRIVHNPYVISQPAMLVDKPEPVST